MKHTIATGELAIIFFVCVLSASVVAPAVDANWSETPWSDAIVMFPLLAWVAGMVAVPFAAVATFVGAIGLLIVRQYAADAKAATWTLGGAAVGAGIGLLHPFCLLSAFVEYRAGDPTLRDSLRLAKMVGASGALAGGIAAFWYRRRWPLSSAIANRETKR